MSAPAAREGRQQRAGLEALVALVILQQGRGCAAVQVAEQPEGVQQASGEKLRPARLVSAAAGRLPAHLERRHYVGGASSTAKGRHQGPVTGRAQPRPPQPCHGRRLGQGEARGGQGCSGHHLGWQ